jgi:hypothetical protein
VTDTRDEIARLGVAKDRAILHIHTTTKS